MNRKVDWTSLPNTCLWWLCMSIMYSWMVWNPSFQHLAPLPPSFGWVTAASGDGSNLKRSDEGHCEMITKDPTRKIIYFWCMHMIDFHKCTIACGFQNCPSAWRNIQDKWHVLEDSWCWLSMMVGSNLHRPWDIRGKKPANNRLKINTIKEIPCAKKDKTLLLDVGYLI